MGLIWGFVGAAITFAGSASAFRRDGSRRVRALTWGLAFAAAATTYLAWGSYSEPFARPGDLNIVTLENRGFTSSRGRIHVEPELIHDLRRFAVSVPILAVIAGTFAGAHRSTRARTLASGTLLGVAWVACLLPIIVVAIASLYAGEIVSHLFPLGIKMFVLAGSVAGGGAVCGLLVGTVTKLILRPS